MASDQINNLFLKYGLPFKVSRVKDPDFGVVVKVYYKDGRKNRTITIGFNYLDAIQNLAMLFQGSDARIDAVLQEAMYMR